MTKPTPKQTGHTPSFAARWDEETLLAKPLWVEIGTAFDKALATVRLNPEQGVDITPVWKTLTPRQRQDLLARGWTVRDTRTPGQVILGVNSDALAAKRYFAAKYKTDWLKLGISILAPMATRQP